MKRNRTALRCGNGESGQVLILAVVALILVIIAILLLFDVQTVIRGKVKAQNGVDAAALTGAEWQKHSLNMIGELNLVRAAGTRLARGACAPIYRFDAWVCSGFLTACCLGAHNSLMAPRLTAVSGVAGG